jgi:hypothetical protein
MSTLEAVEEAVERLSPGELEEFLRWLSRHAGVKLGLVPGRPSAQELADRFDARVQDGSAMPFAGVDLSPWPTAARDKAQAMIADWRAKHGK